MGSRREAGIAGPREFPGGVRVVSDRKEEGGRKTYIINNSIPLGHQACDGGSVHHFTVVAGEVGPE